MNYLKTAILLAGMTALLILSVAMVTDKFGTYNMVGAFAISLIINFLFLLFSDKIVLYMYDAKPIVSGSVYDITAELAKSAGLPIPRVYIIDIEQPNAFATGRSPEHASVAVTRGITEVLDERELRGVIAHELSHIKNRDTLTMVVAATIAGAFSVLTRYIFRGKESNSKHSFIANFLVIIFAPFAAALIKLAISRTREYSADHTGAEICGDPQALASALEKISYTAGRVDNHVAQQNPATAHLFIINPLHAGGMDNLFSTHPNTKNRIARLMQMVSGNASAPANKQAKSPWNIYIP